MNSSATVQEKGLRYNEGKLKWSYVNFKALWPLVKGLMYGANKYAPNNWKKGLDRAEILESMQRHLSALIDGEEVDPESGVSHMGHIQCNTMFYNYFYDKDNGIKKYEIIQTAGQGEALPQAAGMCV